MKPKTRSGYPLGGTTPQGDLTQPRGTHLGQDNRTDRATHRFSHGPLVAGGTCHSDRCVCDVVSLLVWGRDGSDVSLPN